MHPFKVSNPVAFRVFRELCSHHGFVKLEFCVTQKRKPISYLPIPQPRGKMNLYLLQICLLKTFLTGELYNTCFLWLADLTEHHVFKVHVCGRIGQCLVSLSGWEVGHVDAMSHPIFSRWTLSFHFWWLQIVDVEVLCGHSVFNFLDSRPKNGIAGSGSNSMFNFLRKCQDDFQTGCNISQYHQWS